ncbi:MAG: YggT family protein [Pseudomonadota bacterium]
MGGALGEVVVLIVNNLGALFILAVLLRFLLQAVRADFYNPVSQAIVKITAKPLIPFRKVIPGYRGFDFASLVLALVLNSIFTAIMILAKGFSLPGIGIVISWAFVGLISFILNIYYFGLIISVIASFIAPFSGNPILLMIYQILDPINSRVRRVIPPMGGLDLSPLFIFLGIKVLQIILLTPLMQQLRLDPSYVIGI